MPIPARTKRAHYPQSDPRCDQVATLNKAARSRPGRRYADLNAVRCADNDVNLHWADSAARNHYRYIQVNAFKRRPMTSGELHRPVIGWDLADVRRWRKTARRGRSLASRSHPASVLTRQRQARLRLVKICWELKSRVYGQRPELAREFVAKMAATRWPAYYMTLAGMKDWQGKMRYFKAAGGPTALLPHGGHRPSDLDENMPNIDAIWGRWR